MTTRVPLPVVQRGPETLFGVRVTPAAAGVVSGSMPLRSMRGADGRPSAGALGVLVDNVLGLSIIATRPPDHWSVSTEIDIDILPGLFCARGPVRAEGASIHTDPSGGLATGRVTDGGGRLVALCSERGRFVPVGPIGLEGGDQPWSAPRTAASDVWELMGLAPSSPHEVELEVSAARRNPIGNLHGGITLAVSELLATSAIAATDGPALVTASIHVSYVRPIPADAMVAFRAEMVHRSRSLAVVDVTGSSSARVCTAARIVAHRLP